MGFFDSILDVGKSALGLVVPGVGAATGGSSFGLGDFASSAFDLVGDLAPSAIAAGGSALATRYAADQARSGAREANVASAESVEKQIRFQERAYRNRYQFQMEDMKQAGLNPMLAYSQGPPSGPQGARYQPLNVEGQTGEIIGRGAATAVQAYRASEEMKRVRAQTNLTKAQSRNVYEDTLLKKAQTDQTYESAIRTVAETKHTMTKQQIAVIEKKITAKNLKIKDLELIRSKLDIDILKTSVGEISRLLKTFGFDATSASSLAKVLVGFFKK